MTIRVTLLQRFAIAPDETGVTLRLRPRAQRLVAYLALRRDRSLPREQVAFALWPDELEEDALATLRRALSDVRAALGSTAADGPLDVTAGELRWNATQHCCIDVVEYERLIEQGTPASLHDAVERYTGDLLAEWDDDWIGPERDRLRQAQLDALRQLVAHHRALREFDAALGLARRALALDPLAESAHRDLIALQAQRGDRAAALAAYERLATLLRDELDVEPMPETEALRAAIASGAPLPGVEPPAAQVRRPAAATEPARLFGRDSELRFLTEEWDATVAGRGRLAILSGEARACWRWPSASTPRGQAAWR
jgi:DNA-binding SARP family transcriptional activator